MKTEARKAYEKQMPRWEMLLRDRITNEKQLLELWKCQLADALELAEHNEKDLRCTEENLAFIRESIHAQKHLIQFLKNGLPRHRPAGVMAKCPFCGAKQSDSLTLKNGKGEGVTVKALYALEDVFDDFMAVGCRNCGARIAYPKYDDTTIQDLIDVWNRRA